MKQLFGVILSFLLWTSGVVPENAFDSSPSNEVTEVVKSTVKENLPEKPKSFTINTSFDDIPFNKDKLPIDFVFNEFVSELVFEAVPENKSSHIPQRGDPITIIVCHDTSDLNYPLVFAHEPVYGSIFKGGPPGYSVRAPKIPDK
jgi:hypothetical protein